MTENPFKDALEGILEELDRRRQVIDFREKVAKNCFDYASMYQLDIRKEREILNKYYTKIKKAYEYANEVK